MRLFGVIIITLTTTACSEDGLSKYIADKYPKFSEVRPGSTLYVPGRFGIVDVVKLGSSNSAEVVVLSRVCRVNIPVPEDRILLTTYKYEAGGGSSITADVLSQVVVSGAKAVDIVDHIDVTPTKASIISLDDPDIRTATAQALREGCGYTVKNGEMITGAIKATLTANVVFKASSAIDFSTQQELTQAIAGRLGFSASVGSNNSISGENVYIAVRTEKIDKSVLN